MTRKWDVTTASRMKEEKGLTYRELAAIVGIPKSTIQRNIRKYRKESVASQIASSPTPENGRGKAVPFKDSRGIWMKKEFTGEIIPRAKSKLSNRELFDSYMSEDFIRWMVQHEPRSFLDAWTRLQPKDMQIGLQGNISMELAPYDPRVAEITLALSNGLSMPAQVRRIREILGMDRVVVELEPLQLEDAQIVESGVDSEIISPQTDVPC